MALSLGAIVDALGGELHGDRAVSIERLAPLKSAQADALTFLSSSKFNDDLVVSKAACVIVAPAMREIAAARGAFIVASDPQYYFALLTQLWKAHLARPGTPRIHPSAIIDPGADIDSTARIGALCVIERGVRIGADTVLKSNVTVSEDCIIGARCNLYPGVVIGADGFGNALHEGKWVKIEQLGAVRIGDDVDIGANTCIDRGALDDTVIEDGVKLDNLIQIGHNVRIGKHTAMAGCTGVAGSTSIGAHCTIGGQGIIIGHVTIADGVHISAGTTVMGSILKPGHYTGVFPIDDNASWQKNAATVRQLHTLRDRLRALEKAATQDNKAP
ncbi:MAG: UDP-3-O-(3-hydroxymyristoyl)glucosamine N-acyltransferase [Variovorax sp.]|nr:UDP-3-O-(3-hydroxymyristoyl)glucosamine N-acyltransferase [Variovorax sp.]